MRRPALPAASALPAWVALAVASVGGVSSAVQSAANAELGERVGNASFGAVASTVTGSALIVVGLVAMPSMRRGLRVLPPPFPRDLGQNRAR